MTREKWWLNEVVVDEGSWWFRFTSWWWDWTIKRETRKLKIKDHD